VSKPPKPLDARASRPATPAPRPAPPGAAPVEVLDARGRQIEADAEAEADDEDEDTSDEDSADGGEDRATLPVLAGRPALSGGGRREDLLAYYLAEVRRYPLLDPEEEKRLAIEYRETGDPEAAQRLVTANLRLVVKLAFQYHRQWSNVLDLIQEGNVGLVEALSRYDPYRGIRFSSYAQYWIRAMILRFLMDNYRMVRLGSTRHGRKLFFQLQKERDRLIREGVNPSTLALSQALDVPEQEIIHVDQLLSAPALSLHSPASGDEGRPLSETVANDRAEDPEANVARTELGELFRGHLKVFAATLKDERELAIWSERLTAQEPASLSDLGLRFGVSKERVRQLEARLKKRLKEHLTAQLGDEIPIILETPDVD
jgi:RNA polymerase sigma-32 factor